MQKYLFAATLFCCVSVGFSQVPLEQLDEDCRRLVELNAAYLQSLDGVYLHLRQEQVNSINVDQVWMNGIACRCINDNTFLVGDTNRSIRDSLRQFNGSVYRAIRCNSLDDLSKITPCDNKRAVGVMHPFPQQSDLWPLGRAMIYVYYENTVYSLPDLIQKFALSAEITGNEEIYGVECQQLKLILPGTKSGKISSDIPPGQYDIWIDTHQGSIQKIVITLLESKVTEFTVTKMKPLTTSVSVMNEIEGTAFSAQSKTKTILLDGSLGEHADLDPEMLGFQFPKYLRVSTTDVPFAPESQPQPTQGVIIYGDTHDEILYQSDIYSMPAIEAWCKERGFPIPSTTGVMSGLGMNSEFSRASTTLFARWWPLIVVLLIASLGLFFAIRLIAKKRKGLEI